jgi:phosphatidylglycerophosphatase A
MPIWHPARLFATWFGSGLLPAVPGTWGSLAALPFAAVIVFYFGPIALLLATVLVFALGVWTSELVARAIGDHDPSEVVVDEVAGQWLTLALLPLDPVIYGLGFVVFRVFDILKPWPVSWADQKLPGGWGIMTDDILAGIYAGLLCYLVTLLV